MPRVKIICTIGPASRSAGMLRRLIETGMDVARLNFSHGDLETHAENIDRIRAAADEIGKPVAILADLQGPKLRVGRMPGNGYPLVKGSEVTFTTREGAGRPGGPLPVQYRGLPRLLKPGDPVLVDDGLLELRVLSASDTEIRCKVLVGGLLKSNKGVNLPCTELDVPAITTKDRRDLAFALDRQVDWIALSFVREAQDIVDLKQLIREQSPPGDPTPVMAKIEKPEALANIDEIIANADALMVARGDLGIEIRPEEVPVAQKRIIRKCNEFGIPVVTATQMLDSMIRNPRPTRAEASDVANAILDGTDGLMLSGETSIGAYPVEAVRTMVCIATELGMAGPRVFVCPIAESHGSDPFGVAGAVCHAARETARHLGAAAIITPTASGYTARLMSHYRPRSPIVAVTPNPVVQRRLALYWSVNPLLAARTDNTDEMIAQAIRAARDAGLVNAGDTVVVTAGSAASVPGTTDLMRVSTVEDSKDEAEVALAQNGL